jgi:transglutaminase-like putative cysteine protease
VAAETGSAPAGDRRILVVALALLGGVTGVEFGRVFLGTHPALRLAAAGLLATGVAALMARRHIALSLAASLAGLLFALGILVFPGTTWLGLPGPRTVEALVAALRVVTDRAATEIAPAPPLAPLMTASVMAVWSAGTAAHALAIRSGSSLLPLLPAASLLGFAGVVTEEPPRPGYVLLFLVAAFAVLFAEALQRASSWGVAPPRAAAVFSGRWARVLGGGAAALAMTLPGVLPGFGHQGVLDLEGGGDRIGVSPIVDIRPSLRLNPVADLFSVRATRPSYWRMVVLDEFDGRLWKPSTTQEGGLEHLGVGFDELTSIPPPRQRLLDQEIEIHDLGTPWLPAAANPVAIGLEDDLGATHDLRTGVLALESETSEGVRYEVTSAQAWPTLRTLESLTPNNPLGDPRYTALPPGIPERIRQIALDVAGRADSVFHAVLSIQNYLRSFTYDENAPAGHGTDDMIHFLEVSRRGYCEQFAGAMAVMVRSLGIPARVSIGFLPGDQDQTGRFRVTTAQVHAWPEVHFGDYGWLAFEPTPGRSNPSAGYLLPPSLRARGNQGAAGGGAESSPRSAAELRESFQPSSTAVPQARGIPEGGGTRSVSWTRVVQVAVGIVLFLLLLIAPVRALWRFMVLRRAGDPRRRVLQAYAWLLDGAAGVRKGRRPEETPLEYGSRLGEGRDVSEEALGRITTLAEQALYSPREPGRLQGDQAVASTRTVLRDLRRDAGPIRTLAGALRPARPRP